MSVPIKQAVHAQLSAARVARLRRVREAFRPATWSMRLASVLPTTHAVAVKEAIHATGCLDYAHGPIRLDVGSRMETARLSACAKEPETVAWIESHLRPGDVFYDIGANVGAYSFVANAVMRGQGRVYAFEAGFATFASLSRNVFLNHAAGAVVPVHVALSSRTRLLELRHRDLRAGAAEHQLTTSGNGVGPNGAFAQPVLGYRLDDLVRQFGLEPPNAIKLDVDGVALDVLEGAGEMLRSPGLRTLLVEIDEGRDPDGRIPRMLTAAGLAAVSRRQRGSNGTQANHVFVRKGSA